MTLPNPQETATRVSEEWMSHARPIIKAYLALIDVSLVKDICINHYERTPMEKQRTRDYREAESYIVKAQDALYDMLEGIRENYISDHGASYPYSADEATIDAADEFNTALARDVLSVEAAVRVVEDER